MKEERKEERKKQGAGKPPLVVLTGPTAVGKSDLSLRLAKEIGGSIISADSMQVYRGMDIGTAKLAKKDRQGIPHDLIDIRDPSDAFHIVDFQKEANRAISRIQAMGRIPVLTGGTGFYIQSVLYPIDFKDASDDPLIRARLEKLAQDKGPSYLHRILERLDPESAGRIHPNNVRRTVRALEFYLKTGQSIAVHNRTEAARESDYAFCYFVLNMDRQKLYDRIDERVDRMIEAGLVEEVRGLLDGGLSRDAVSMQGLGYKEIAACLAGELTLEEAVRILKRDTRHFAKRQLTWFRRERDVIWVQKEDFCFDEDRILAFLCETMKSRGILIQN